MVISPRRCLLVCNNAISARTGIAAASAEGFTREKIAVIALRSLKREWVAGAGEILNYPRKGVRSTLIGRGWELVLFYLRARRIIDRLVAGGSGVRVFLVNNDNLVTGHLFQLAGSGRSVTIAVVTEGMMNFQDIAARNRSRIGLLVKRLFAPLLGFRFRHPVGHLSGSFDPVVTDVYTFMAQGLRAPASKVRVVKIGEPVSRSPALDAERSALVVLSGLWQWMTADNWSNFVRRFTAWLDGKGFVRVYIKSHPNVHDGGLATAIPNAVVWGEGRSIEELAGDIPASTVIASCCTALLTLPALRPDLTYIDFGSDIYVPHAYFGDESAVTALAHAGVQIVVSTSEAR